MLHVSCQRFGFEFHQVYQEPCYSVSTAKLMYQFVMSIEFLLVLAGVVFPGKIDLLLIIHQIKFNGDLTFIFHYRFHIIFTLTLFFFLHFFFGQTAVGDNCLHAST